METKNNWNSIYTLKTCEILHWTRKPFASYIDHMRSGTTLPPSLTPSRNRISHFHLQIIALWLVTHSLSQWLTEFTPATRSPFPNNRKQHRLRTPPPLRSNFSRRRRRSPSRRREPTSSRSPKTKSTASLRRRTPAATTSTLAGTIAGAGAAAASVGSSESSSSSSCSSALPPVFSTSFSVRRLRTTPSTASLSEE